MTDMATDVVTVPIAASCGGGCKKPCCMWAIGSGCAGCAGCASCPGCADCTDCSGCAGRGAWWNARGVAGGPPAHMAVGASSDVGMASERSIGAGMPAAGNDGRISETAFGTEASSVADADPGVDPSWSIIICSWNKFAIVWSLSSKVGMSVRLSRSFARPRASRTSLDVWRSRLSSSSGSRDIRRGVFPCGGMLSRLRGWFVGRPPKVQPCTAHPTHHPTQLHNVAACHALNYN